MSDTPPADAAPPPPKKGRKKLLVILAALIVVAGGTGGGLYAAGIVGGHDEPAADDGKPRLVPKSEQKRGTDDGEAGGHGDDAASEGHGGKPTPAGSGGDRYASNYYALDKDFTSNLSDSDRFVQVGLAISTPYDDTVIDHLKTNEIAVRSAVLMALGDTTEEQVMDEAGKQKLQARLVRTINGVLQEKEGFGGVGNVYFTNFVVQ